MKKYNESSQLNYLQTGLTISDAYRLVWNVGNIALEKQNQHSDQVRQDLAVYIGKLFGAVDSYAVEEETLRLNNSNVELRIRFGQFLEPFEQEINRIETMNSLTYPFTQEEVYLEGIRAASDYLKLSYTDLKRSKPGL